MCFDDGDSHCLSTRHVRVRKQRRCYDCGRDMLPGTLAQKYVWIDDRHFLHGDICERCQWLVARIYAEERADGCSHNESWPAIGGGELERWYRERTYYAQTEEED